jgi:hypothetical protein
MLGVLCVIGYLLWNAEKPPATPDGNVLLVNTVTEAGLTARYHRNGKPSVRCRSNYRSAMRASSACKRPPSGGEVT